MSDLKVFKILEPPSKEFLERILSQRRLKPEKYKDYIHPQEDYLLQSERYPIFAVADGVTLELDKNGNYPRPSGASEAARIFCEEIVKEAEKIYDKFGEAEIEPIFKKANDAVGEYNRANGRTKETINFWDFDLFAATAAFAAIKDETVFWGSICDSYVAHFDKNGRLKFKSPECWPRMRRHLPADWEAMGEKEKRIMTRKIYRNGLDEHGNLIGYGVITGEEAALKYFNSGAFKAEPGDLIFLFTDGFEKHLELPEFIDLFKEWPINLESKVKEFTAQKIKENPEEFGRERSLIALFFNEKL